MQESSEEVVKVSDVASSLTSVFGASGATFTSLDRQNRRHMYVYMRCLNDCTGRLETLLNNTVAIQHVFAHKVSLVNEATGEVKDQVRIVLITPTFDTYECVSDGVARDVLQLMDLFGQPPWIPALEIKPVQVSLKGGKRMFKLRLAGEPPADEPATDNAKNNKKGK